MTDRDTTAPARPSAARTLRVTSCNLEYGGIDRRTGDNSSALVTLRALLADRPDLLAIQEMHAPDPGNLRRQLWWWANELDMHPFLGPCASIGSTAGNFNAILVRTGPGIQITDEWPGPAGAQLPFCRAELDIPGLDQPVQFTCAHLAARSITRRREHAEIIGSCSADTIAGGGHVIVAGDFNGFPRFGADIGLLPDRLLSARAVVASDGTHQPDVTADDALTSSGLEDLGALLAIRHNNADHAAPTGPGGVRVDRIYADPSLAKLATAYRRFETAADHDAVSVVFDLSRT
jgi:endonuclease/exonuclease/phosphatase family metal-dependent hydrolase